LTQWARRLGGVVIAVVSNQEKARLAAALGADHVIISSQEDFSEATKRLTNNVGANVIFDAVGADSFARSLDALAVHGHLVSFGQASGPIGSYDIGKLSGKSLTISRPNYGHYTDTKEKLGRNVARFFSMLRNGAVRVSTPQAYALSRASDAHRDLESRRTTGSLILTP
jgi:NADPH2:quinone reductase